jgi:LacI family transcriptional regulator
MKSASSKTSFSRRVLLLLGVYSPANHEGIARYAREVGWALDNTYAISGRVPFWWKGDGIITLITHPKDYAALRSLPNRPLVDLSKGWITNAMPPALRRTGRNRPRVLYDNVAAGRLAAEHFLERGFRHIALYNRNNFWMELERRPSFQQTILAAGAEYHEIPYYTRFSLLQPGTAAREHAAFRWLAGTIRNLPRPLGIFAPADDIAVDILLACDHAGLRVPEEVAVLGCGNERMICPYAPMPLSSVDTDFEQQGYEAARLLDRLMNGEPPPAEPIIIPPKGVVTRQSTNILAVPHVHVARGLRFIWEHHHEPIQASDVVAAAGMSRRGLERGFLQHLHRTIGKQIQSCRIQSAQTMLVTTDLKAYEVAERCGFGDMLRFSKVFKRELGETPSQYRRRHRTG